MNPLEEMEVDEVVDVECVASEPVNPSVLYAPADFENHWVEDMEDEQYHDDKTAVGSTSVRLMLQSPKAFYWGYFLGFEKEETKDMKLGKLIHMALLEGSKFKERYVVMPIFRGKTGKGEWTTNANCADVKNQRRKWIDEQRPDAVITTEEERIKIIGIIESVMAHPDSGLLINNARPEISGYYRDPETGIRCKIRIDLLTKNLKIMADLKSARSAEWRQFGVSAYKLRYDLQLAMYSIGCKEISGVEPDMTPTMVVEKVWPYESAIYLFEKEDLGQAMLDYRRALSRLDLCIKENKWPQRQEQAQRIYTPKYFIDNSVEDESIEEGSQNDGTI